jgi:hypothetical protein
MTLHDGAVFLSLMRHLFIPGESASKPLVSESATEKHVRDASPTAVQITCTSLPIPPHIATVAISLLDLAVQF